MVGLFCHFFLSSLTPPLPPSSLSKVHGNGPLTRIRYASGIVATDTAMVTDADAAASASNAPCSTTYSPTHNPSHIPTHGPAPSIDLTRDFLHDPVLDDLLCTLMSLFVAVAALLVAPQAAVVEGLHGLRFGEVVVIRELHGAERAAVLLHTAGAATVVLVDAARCRGGAAQLLKALELLVQLSEVRRELFVS